MPEHSRRYSAAPFRRGLASIAVPALLLTSCMVGPDFLRPTPPQHDGYTKGAVDLSLAGSAEAPQHLALGQKISGDWWELFHSPQLDAVLRQAVADNRTLAAAKASLAQAQELVVQAGGQLYPQLSLGAGASRQSGFSSPGVPASGPPSNFYSIGPNLSYAVDLFGGIARSVEKQEALADFQDYQFSAAYLTLTGNAVIQAIQIASVRAQLKTVGDIIAEDESNLASVQKLYKLQEATKIDVESAASQLATDRTLLPPLRQQLSTTRHALAVLVGKAPVEWSAPDFELDELVLPKEIPVSLPSELVHQRPDILAAEAQLHASSAEVGVATAQLYPNITLSATLMQQALKPNHLFTAGSTAWDIASSLTAPIFNGFALEAQKRGADAALQASLANYQQTILTSFSQVADLLSALEHDAELIEYQRHAVEATQSSARLTRGSFEAGDAKLLQVLDAERLYQQARLGYVRAIAQRHADTAQLFVAMGGGWQKWREAEAAKAASADSAAPAPAKRPTVAAPSVAANTKERPR